jgi:hypothetical protein
MTAAAHHVRVRKVKTSGETTNAVAGRHSPTTAVGVAKSAVQRKTSRSKRVAKSSVAGRAIACRTTLGVDAFAQRIANATPIELIEVERNGVKGRFIKDLSTRIGVPAARVYEILGIPKATVKKRVAEGANVTGAAGHAALGMA